MILNAELQREFNEIAALLQYRRGDSFPQDFPRERAVAASVMSNPAGEFEQKIVIAAGSADGIRVYDAVVTGRGLVGHVSKVLRDQAQVTMLTDQESAVTARVISPDARAGALPRSASCATARARRSSSTASPRSERSRRRTSSSPPAAGRAVSAPSTRAGSRSAWSTSVGQTDVDQYQDVQVEPHVDFSDLDSVLVLVPKKR